VIARRSTHDQNIVLLALLASSATIAAQTATHRAFAAPEDAVKALAETVKTETSTRCWSVFGPEGQELVASSDPATAHMKPPGVRRRVQGAVASRGRDAPQKTLVVGNEEWPFPVPLVKGQTAGDSTRRRQGRSAGAADWTQRAGGDRDQPCLRHRAAALRATGTRRQARGIHATKFQSDPGKENGLYWPTARGQKRSPLGDLVAQAAEEGRPLGANRAQPTPFHGYYFKILTGQGAAASGRAKSYIVKGEMSGDSHLSRGRLSTTRPGS
jgi:hypothetical protein